MRDFNHLGFDGRGKNENENAFFPSNTSTWSSFNSLWKPKQHKQKIDISSFYFLVLDFSATKQRVTPRKELSLTFYHFLNHLKAFLIFLIKHWRNYFHVIQVFHKTHIHFFLNTANAKKPK